MHIEGLVATMPTDFGALSDRGLLKSSIAQTPFRRVPLKRGVWVLLADHEGNTCLGQVVQTKKNLVRLRPDWTTWESMPTLTLPTTFRIGNSLPPPLPSIQSPLRAAPAALA